MTERKRSEGMFASDAEYVPDELDHAILAVLPDEGAKLGKYLPQGLQVKRIRQLVDAVVPTGTYAARLKLMRGGGYVVSVRASGVSGGSNSGKAWQRTKKGRMAAGIDKQAANG